MFPPTVTVDTAHAVDSHFRKLLRGRFLRTRQCLQYAQVVFQCLAGTAVLLGFGVVPLGCEEVAAEVFEDLPVAGWGEFNGVRHSR